MTKMKFSTPIAIASVLFIALSGQLHAAVKPNAEQFSNRKFLPRADNIFLK